MTGWNMWEHGVPDSRLTVLKQTEDHIQSNGRHVAMWTVRCNCEKQTIFKALGDGIRQGNTKSCGCLNDERRMQREDLTGRVFGKLTVLSPAPDYIRPNGKHVSMWIVECSCNQHTVFEASGAHLKSGHTQSCGCLRAEKTQESHKKYNDYYGPFTSDGCSEYYIGITKNTGNKFYVSAEHFQTIKQYCWSETVTKTGYHRLSATINGRCVLMHILLGFKYHDHKNRNPLDNRIENLRPATFQENSRNSSLRKNNSSGIVGVTWDKSRSKWRAYISVNNQQTCLGYFSNKEDAIRVRLMTEMNAFGEFAPQQHLFKEYGIEVSNNE